MFDTQPTESNNNDIHLNALKESFDATINTYKNLNRYVYLIGAILAIVAFCGFIPILPLVISIGASALITNQLTIYGMNREHQKAMDTYCNSKDQDNIELSLMSDMGYYNLFLVIGLCVLFGASFFVPPLTLLMLTLLVAFVTTTIPSVLDFSHKCLLQNNDINMIPALEFIKDLTQDAANDAKSKALNANNIQPDNNDNNNVNLIESQPSGTSVEKTSHNNNGGFLSLLNMFDNCSKDSAEKDSEEDTAELRNS